MKKRILTLFIAGTLACAMLTACGDTTEADVDVVETVAEVETAVEAAPEAVASTLEEFYDAELLAEINAELHDSIATDADLVDAYSDISISLDGNTCNYNYIMLDGLELDTDLMESQTELFDSQAEFLSEQLAIESGITPESITFTWYDSSNTEIYSYTYAN